MFYKIIIISLIALFISACDEKVDTNLISSGAKFTKEYAQQTNDIDKKSYQEIAHLFKDNTQIQSKEKNILIIFSANHCVYCDKLKEEILNDKKLQNLIKDDYNSYYINISYKKIHTFNKNHTSDLSTAELSSLYNIVATPTIVILNKNSQTLFNYPGFISAKRLKATMEFLNKDDIKNLSEEIIAKKLLHFYKENNI
ncbi:SoxW family protein [Campylobacter peloridis]|uniref:Thioredoxin-related protein, SoxW family n=1 Tax=Campylobacter peloridis TaxID=488546 RepID=A0A5C7DW50_9BACT|nr:thioredoxin-related protein, SoxW family [Campylobacter peloridis]AJC84697.1 thioredoxin-related protein, SoxW family [Campylobacter peloridis LMG 23910]MBX1886149.1 thioredoxin-related protein, SoxW family [Campylobacter peloridis]MBX2079320.1 thioredoxin-related protein, SoxW family [Campylobacter peloridis]QOQ88761.1 thioredoxin-related protein, SoxW family [Campylobacter peloridis]TXE81699.1 thioredoxin-related protein, SoxW family [Campylobacter peloridis]